MTWIEALVLGLIQGLTEFLPISSSGHLALGNALLGVETEENLAFAVVVHGATMLSTVVIFFKEIVGIFKESLKFQWNESTQYLTKILLSMVPVIFVGLFLEDYIDSFFSGDIRLVSVMLLITACLLTFAHFAKGGTRKIGFKDALIIGIAQAFAVMPGVSRSGATISTGLILGNDRSKIAQFSFLMVLLPILGANMKVLLENDFQLSGGISGLALAVGFVAAFISGLLACQWMISIVKKGKLYYFAIYCAIVGLLAIFL